MNCSRDSVERLFDLDEGGYEVSEEAGLGGRVSKLREKARCHVVLLMFAGSSTKRCSGALLI
jgi:hypothetical protein